MNLYDEPFENKGVEWRFGHFRKIAKTGIQLCVFCSPDNKEYLENFVLEFPNIRIMKYIKIEDKLKDIDKNNFNEISEGMRLTVTAGTAKSLDCPELKLAGKTGTAQNPHGKDQSIFFAFAPVENPKIAIAVVIENAGFGATWAAPIASLMIEQYLTGKHDTRKDLKERMIKGNLNHRNDTTATQTQ
jgi:penicillin-binding protein 2